MLNIPIKKMSAEEAVQWLEKYCGGADRYVVRKREEISGYDPFENRWIQSQIQKAMERLGTDDPAVVFAEHPELYAEYCATAIKVGKRITSQAIPDDAFGILEDGSFLRG
jgi:hypothetical protein